MPFLFHHLDTVLGLKGVKTIRRQFKRFIFTIISNEYRSVQQLVCLYLNIDGRKKKRDFHVFYKSLKFFGTSIASLDP